MTRMFLFFLNFADELAHSSKKENYVSTSTVFVTTAVALCWSLEIMQFYTPCTGASDQEVRSIFSVVSIRCNIITF